MQFTQASSTSLLFFMMICIYVILYLIFNFTRANRAMGGGVSRAKTFAGLLILWIVVLQAIVNSGFVQEQPFPRMVFLFVLINLVTIAAAFSSFGRTFAAGLPLWKLIGFQAFRLPLEFVLHDWVEQGTIPQTMTWTGQNFDILSGVLALVVVLFFKENRRVIWCVNIVGFVLLLNVMRVAVMSSPLPFAWQVQPPLQLAFHLPYALILPICVGGALFMHLVLSIALIEKRVDSASVIR